jgi:hypothetical protein
LPGSKADRVKIVALDGNKRRTALELGVPARGSSPPRPAGALRRACPRRPRAAAPITRW